LTHEQLCERARLWLRGTRRCKPVFSRLASCREIPDAIGWSSAYKWHGSTVIECKTSMSDFHADRRKAVALRHKLHGYLYRGNAAPRYMRDEDLEPVAIPLMGDFRFFFCLPDVISAEAVEKYRPDHGLLYLAGRSVRTIRPAPRRTDVDKDSEIRYLRFAIINRKLAYGEMAEWDIVGPTECSDGRSVSN